MCHITQSGHARVHSEVNKSKVRRIVTRLVQVFTHLLTGHLLTSCLDEEFTILFWPSPISRLLIYYLRRLYCNTWIMWIKVNFVLYSEYIVPVSKATRVLFYFLYKHFCNDHSNNQNVEWYILKTIVSETWHSFLQACYLFFVGRWFVFKMLQKFRISR